jgi:hypothetical protein
MASGVESLYEYKFYSFFGFYWRCLPRLARNAGILANTTLQSAGVHKRRILTAGISVALVATLAATIVVSISLLPLYRRDTADMLPRTTLLLSTAQNETARRRWAQVFPTLTSGVPADAESIAIVRTEETEGWIAFERRSAAHDDSEPALGPFHITVSRESLREALDATTDRLTPMLRKLGRTPRGAWTYIAREALPRSSELPGRVMDAAFLGSAEAMLLEQESGSTVLRMVPSSPLPPLRMETVLPSPFEEPLLVVTLGDATALLAAWEAALGESDWGVVEGVMLAQIAEVLGEGISVRHDLLPLLREQLSLHIARTETDSIAFLLEGSPARPLNAERILEDIHRSFALRHPDIEITSRLFDGRFPARTIRLAEGRTTHEERAMEEWWLRISTDSEDRATLVTGCNGARCLVSNDIAAVERWITGKWPTVLTLPHTQRPIAVRTLVGGSLPGAWLPRSATLQALLGPIPEQIVFALEQDGERRILRVAK